MIVNVKLTSGETLEFDAEEYRQHGELPEDQYEADSENPASVAWSDAAEAAQNPDWVSPPAGWPPHLPVWQAAGAEKKNRIVRMRFCANAEE